MRNQAKLFMLSFALGVSCKSCAFSAETSPSEADPVAFFSGVFFSVDFIDGEVMALKLKENEKLFKREFIEEGREISFQCAIALFTTHGSLINIKGRKQHRLRQFTTI